MHVYPAHPWSVISPFLPQILPILVRQLVEHMKELGGPGVVKDGEEFAFHGQRRSCEIENARFCLDVN